MKKIFLLLLSCILLLSGCSNIDTTAQKVRASENSTQGAPAQKGTADEDEYIKSVWLTYYELQKLTDSANENEFTRKAQSLIREIKQMGFNTLTVQVRPCADAFYASKYFPSSKYCFGVQGANMPYDPLKIICSVCKQESIKAEAWINPYRVSQDNKIDALSDSNIAKKWYSSKRKKSYVYVAKSSIHFNPAVDEVTRLIVNGVIEIVKNYDVYAIHFDDYFYPDTDEKIDSEQYEKYKSKGGKLSLGDWRRENISKMIKAVYSAVKKENPNVKFGISPASNIKNDYSALYADVEKWASEDGYADYICPQIYFGFKNIYQPFMFTTKKWIGITTSAKLYVGLALYKCGSADKYASPDDKSIINEFKSSNNIIARQITYLSKLDEVQGFYVFSYSCLHSEKCKSEVENMLKAMKVAEKTAK